TAGSSSPVTCPPWRRSVRTRGRSGVARRVRRPSTRDGRSGASVWCPPYPSRRARSGPLGQEGSVRRVIHALRGVNPWWPVRAAAYGRAVDRSEAGRSIVQLADLATPMAVRVAATLNLVDLAGGDGATPQRFAAETGAAAPALRRLLDHLVTVGVFDHDPESGRYRPTELGAQMGADAPEGVRPLLDINAAGGRAELGFVELLETVTSGVPGYLLRYGRDFWADLDADPRLRRSFDAQMNW